MTKREFSEHGYDDMVTNYGKKDKRHFEVWFRLFKDHEPKKFRAHVDKVLLRHQSKFWPTPGEFDLIVNGPWNQERIDREFAKNDPEYPG